MMESLLFFVVWGVVLFVMMRYGCGLHVMGQRRNQSDAASRAGQSSENLRWVAPKRDTDPVCGKSVLTASAKPSIHDGRVFYFCSRECREVFETAPDLYTGDERSNVSLLGHGHG